VTFTPARIRALRAVAAAGKNGARLDVKTDPERGLVFEPPARWLEERGLVRISFAGRWGGVELATITDRGIDVLKRMEDVGR
jgi:hypothetical protein